MNKSRNEKRIGTTYETKLKILLEMKRICKKKKKRSEQTHWLHSFNIRCTHTHTSKEKKMNLTMSWNQQFSVNK